MISSRISYPISPNLPVTTTAGIVNAASPQALIAPGSLVAIYGSNLAGATAQASDLPLPTSLGGSQISINGTPAPLLYASPGQVNIQVPYEIVPGTATLTVQTDAGTSAPVSFVVRPVGPGTMTLPPASHALAVNVADGSVNSPQSPAAPGQYLIVYVTGQGSVNPAIPTGAAAPDDPLSYPSAAVLVNIGGQPATVPFAGMAPGFVGLLQLNILVPNVSAGERNLDISIGGVSANTTTVSIAGSQ
jgi:uncharacterized protein (TIGR03437 family)